MSKPKAPKAPDPIATGAMQTGTNIGTAIANQVGGMVNQNDPYGSLSYAQSGTYTYTDPTSGKSYEIPRWTANQTLNPAGQKLQNTNMATQQNLANMARDQSERLGGLLGRPMDMGGVVQRRAAPQLQQIGAGPQMQQVGSGPQMQQVGQAQALRGTIADAGAITRGYQIADRGRVEEALMSRMNPQIAQDRAAMENQLRQQGITVGSAAYDRAMGNLGQQANDARMQAILAGGQEQSRLTALNAGLAGFRNDAQAQAFGQNAARTDAFNTAAQGNFANRLAGTGFNNQARQQQFGNQLSAAGLNNQARQQQFGNQMSAAGFNNASRMDAARFAEAQRAASLGEAYQQRNQPINEITALLGGTQVQQPNFVNAPGLNAPTTDYAGLIQQNYANQLGAYNTQMQNWNGLWGGLMGGVGSLFQGRFA